MKILYRCCLFFLLLIISLQILLVAFIGTDEIAGRVLDIIGFSEKKELVLSIVERIPTSIYIVSLVCLFVAVVVALYKQDKIISYIKNFFRYWKDAFYNLFSSIKNIEVWLVLLIPFGASIYFASNIAVSYDEAITYNLFTSKPFFYCMIFYPYPNNHVLHSLITNLTEYMPFVSTLFAIRIPAILASLFTWLIGYSFLKKFYTSRIALLVVGLASAMYMTIYYSFMSRGYAFMVLAFVVCMYAAFNIIRNGNRKKDWMFFVVAGILGCYTIPSFLYPFATINVLILVYNYRNIKYQIGANLIAGLCVILLYAPIMLVDGIAALTSNQFVQNVSRTEILTGIWNFYKGMLVDITGLPYFIVYFLIASLLVPLFVAIRQKNNWYLSLWIIFIAAPFVLLLLHAVHPFYRTFLYYNFVFVFLIVVPFRNYLEKVPRYILILFIILVQIAGVWSFDSRIREEEGFNTYAKLLANKYFKPENKVLFPCVASANYEFEAKVLNLESNIHFMNNLAVDVDTINNSGYIVVASHRDKTIHKKPFDIIGRQHIYKND